MESSSSVLCRNCRGLDFRKALAEWAEGRDSWDRPKLCYLDPLTDKQDGTSEAEGTSCFLCKSFPREPGWLCSLRSTLDVTSAPTPYPSAAVQLAYELESSPRPLRLGLICVDSKLFAARFHADFSLKWLHSLSYVWGKVGRSEKLPDLLPRTVEDAMQVTNMLGFQYLWVDAYCIDHTSPVIRQRQIRRMDAVYGRAQLTLVAAAGQDAESGLPGVGSRMEIPEVSINTSRWGTRGWTYQEPWLSCRSLVFTTEHVYFECQKMSCWRTKELHNPSPVSDADLENELKARSDKGPIVWQTHVGNNPDTANQRTYLYKGLGSTRYGSSHLQVTGGKLLDYCGLPWDVSQPNTIVKSLCWSHEEKLLSLHGVPVDRRPALPSWSWAGWSGAFGQMFWNDSRWTEDMELVNAMDGALGPNTILEVNTRLASNAVVRRGIQQGGEGVQFQFRTGSLAKNRSLRKELVEAGS
ncbi:hypothetical protein PG993_008974 [Apiospora rasikravindrae]|uniref:Heterokaryon incompatibility domain-containing protein n=1 Tax=Apiospora rasikravindrae TaxID=990691 RepID=A0ABR1SJU1_9PEZI